MKIFIADHSEVFRLGLTRLLKNLISDCTISGSESVEVLLGQADWQQTSLVIIQQSNDSKQEDFVAMRTFAESGTKIIVITDQPSLSQARNLFNQGVKGYLDRASPIGIISEAVKKVLSGKAYIEPSLLIQFLDYNATKPKWTLKPHSISLLTGKELELATYLMKGFKTSEISKLLSKKATTISTQKANIYQKLGVCNVVELLYL